MHDHLKKVSRTRQNSKHISLAMVGDPLRPASDLKLAFQQRRQEAVEICSLEIAILYRFHVKLN